MKYLLALFLLSFSFSTTAIAGAQAGFDQCGFDRFIVVAEDGDSEGGDKKEGEEEEEPDCE